jgi:predicted flap endonuclease-1-like 5' DNA nuclease
MKPWMHEDVIKTWTDAQKRLWESLCSAVPFQPPAGVEAWRDTYLKNLATWESAVKQTLNQEATWVEQWVQKVAREKGTPEMVATWVRQMEEVLQRWIQSQNQWWEEYFSVLRRGGFVYPEQMNPQPAVGSGAAATAKEPTLAAAPAANKPVSAVERVEATSSTEAPPDQMTPTSGVASNSEARDDLQLITGIGPAMEKKLNACGVFTYRDLAMLNDQDIERIEAVIKFAGRLRREDWIGQAKARYLHKYQEPL